MILGIYLNIRPEDIVTYADIGIKIDAAVHFVGGIVLVTIALDELRKDR